MRIDDSPDLFGSGVGSSTVGKITCEYCGKTYNADNETPDGEIIDPNGPWFGTTEFAGKTVVDCCWEKIEREILSRMPDILKWYARIVANRREVIEGVEDQMSMILEALRREKLAPRRMSRLRSRIVSLFKKTPKVRRSFRR